ncbi:hypothetical protein [Spirulina sp. 06S082]|uniref:hypothetical protein n=1 Tax=Spirulina sp. 06S082 TaxID=3110248 RepID=UPI002B214944|nr:hypothetical protein [Spirulina sp. 06S082]MEA5469249.1 hypothetical protein [Spirulina sp. 06S082]
MSILKIFQKLPDRVIRKYLKALINRSDRDAIYLEIGDRTSGDTVIYPDDDLLAEMGEKGWKFTRKNGEAY